MTSIPPETSTFTFFGHLPPELRSKIWDASLEGIDRPVVYFYRPSTEFSRLDVESRFTYQLLAGTGDVEIKISIFFVNREAHAVARAWIRDRGIVTTHFDESLRKIAFFRPFKPTYDYIYVPSHSLSNFGQTTIEYANRLQEDDRDAVPLHLNLAIPASRFEVVDHTEKLRNGFFFHSMGSGHLKIHNISIVFGSAPDPALRGVLNPVGWELKPPRDEDAKHRVNWRNGDPIQHYNLKRKQALLDYVEVVQRRLEEAYSETPSRFARITFQAVVCHKTSTSSVLLW